MHINALSYKKDNLTYLYQNIDPNPYFKIVANNDCTAFGLHLLLRNVKCFDSPKTF